MVMKSELSLIFSSVVLRLALQLGIFLNATARNGGFVGSLMSALKVFLGCVFLEPCTLRSSWATHGLAPASGVAPDG